MSAQALKDTEILFKPTSIGALALANRLVMAPMTRCFSPDGVPGADVAAYYRRRAEGGIGLIVTEGTWIPHASASNDPNVPRFYGDDALDGWKHVVDEVHGAGGRIVPQLWHVGQVLTPQVDKGVYGASKDLYGNQVGPSGMVGPLGEMPKLLGRALTEPEIGELIDAYGSAAASAQRIGFDGVELHGAHGYLIDQFNWAVTNLRNDRYGGDIADRTRFACEIVKEIRRRVGPDFPIIMRFSQWKLQNYGARLAETPDELASFLQPMVDAGVDAFHCSQRRFWEREFGSDFNLAGWARKLTGLPSISVGSVGLDQDFISTTVHGERTSAADIGDLLEMMERGDFDMIAIGRALIVDPDWANKIREGNFQDIVRYSTEALTTLA